MTELADRYLSQLLALLPVGPAWPRDPGTVRHGQLGAIAEGLARVEQRGGDLLTEADPRTTLEMLADWERVAGLPDPCSAGIATTLQERRAAVIARLVATGGQSLAYFQGLAEALGYRVRIREYRPFVCGKSRLGRDALNGGHEVRHVWRVGVIGPRVTWFRCGASRLGVDRLGKITRAEDLDCLLKRLKPAQTTLVVGYDDSRTADTTRWSADTDILTADLEPA